MNERITAERNQDGTINVQVTPYGATLPTLNEVLYLENELRGVEARSQPNARCFISRVRRANA
jgi:hypothetical protein